MSERFSSPTPGLSRNALIISGVLLLHIGALWALQSGLLRKAAEVVIPVHILSQFVEPPKPVLPPPPPAPPPTVKPVVKTPRPTPRPQAIRTPAPPAPEAPVGTVEPPPPAPPVETPPAPATPPAPPAVQLPTTDADYAQGCKPVYPSMSKRLGEQGRVTVRVVVSADGRPGQVDVKKSSGFDRLDTAAREAMQRCRFVPGKVNGVAQSMAYDAPVNFVLN